VTNNLHDLLLEKLLEYQQQSGERKTLKQFAEYIGMGQVYLNQIMNGRRSAGEKTIAHLANFFKDMRFYDAVELPRPDPNLNYITRHWGETPKEIQQKIAEEIARFTTEEAPNDD
jgi:transcriptional regulator with XRE-family HTH domain